MMKKYNNFWILLLVASPLLVFAGMLYVYTLLHPMREQILNIEFNGRLVIKPTQFSREGIILVLKNKGTQDTLFVDNFNFNYQICELTEIGDSIVAIKNEPTFKIIKKDTVLILNKYEYENKE